MSATPEAKVKADVKAFLKSRGVTSISALANNRVGYYHMYVPSGYGDPALDFSGCYKGRFFAIETKANGNVPSARQRIIIACIADALGFVIWGDDAADLCKRLGEFFDYVDAENGILDYAHGQA